MLLKKDDPYCIEHGIGWTQIDTTFQISRSGLSRNTTI